MFIDRVTIFVKGGDGGRGCCSFRREKYEPKGGPDGGDGGAGGSVIIRAVAGADSLADIVNRKHVRAPSGNPGSGAQKVNMSRTTAGSISRETRGSQKIALISEAKSSGPSPNSV